MLKAKPCTLCGSPWHNRGFCPTKKRKRINQQSTKEIEYQLWKETICRPALIARDGNLCQCCFRPAYESEKLDIEHELNKGSHPDLKRSMANLRLYCRYPCHDNKTNHKPCVHNV